MTVKQLIKLLERCGPEKDLCLYLHDPVEHPSEEYFEEFTGVEECEETVYIEVEVTDNR